jgi:hypothetical protein
VEERLGKLEEIQKEALNNILRAQDSLKMKKQGSKHFSLD